MIPGTYRRKVLVRLDGARFVPQAAGTHRHLRRDEGQVLGVLSRLVVHRPEIDAIDRAPKTVWQNGIDQDGTLLDDTWVADITGLLDLSEWTWKIPILRSSPWTSPFTRGTPSGPATGRRPAAAIESLSRP